VVADLPLDDTIEGLLGGRVELLPWSVAREGSREPVQGMFTYGHPEVTASMLDGLPGLWVISNYGIGVNHIDVAAADARGIAVGNTPGVLEETTADLGFALLLAVARKIVEGDRYARSPEFLRYDPAYMLGTEVHGTTLGIIGMGHIGSLVARRARAFNMTVLYHNRRPRPEVESALGVQYTTLDDLLARSDYVMLCTPLTDQTRGLMGAANLAKMKPTATLVNISRGQVVDTSALLAALQNGTIAAAALDVTDPEPLPRDHGLLSLPNVVIVPHLGSATVQTRRRMTEVSIDNLMAGLRGEPLLHRVGGAPKT
jgi:glyoxylate reductase